MFKDVVVGHVEHTWNICVGWGGVFKDVVVGHVELLPPKGEAVQAATEQDLDAFRLEPFAISGYTAGGAFAY